MAKSMCGGRNGFSTTISYYLFLSLIFGVFGLRRFAARRFGVEPVGTLESAPVSAR